MVLLCWLSTSTFLRNAVALDAMSQQNQAQLLQQLTPEQMKLLRQLSPEQISALQKMSPSQRADALKEMGVSGAAGKAAAETNLQRDDGGPPDRGGRPDRQGRRIKTADAAKLSKTDEFDSKGGTDDKKDKKYKQARDGRKGKKASNLKSGIDEALDDNSGEALDLEKTQDSREEKTVEHKLEQFGYDLFTDASATFAPASDIPVPYDYVIGPGDVVHIQLFGKENFEYDLSVSRDGNLSLPGIGPVSVSGQKFEAMSNNLNERIARQMIGVKSSITMGSLRSIRVFVLGDVTKPGSYTVSALSTMTNALFESGGIKPIGSLRSIELKRGGRVVTRLDLYDLLLEGDTRKDSRLHPGDVIFVPPIGETVGVAGEVRRPAIYELNGEKTVGEALKIAGGLLPTSYPQVTQLERINERRERELVDIDITGESGRDTTLRNGDTIRVYSVLEKMDNVVLLAGRVHRPGGYQWHEGMRLTDLIRTVDDLLPETDMKYVLIKRELMPDRKVVALSSMIGEALRDPSSRENLSLMPRDEVMVFGLSDDRQELVRPFIERLQRQAGFGQPEPVVSIEGNVRHPGEYPREDGMKLSGLVRAAMDILPETDMDYALVVREHDNGERIVPFSISLRDVLGGGSADIALDPRDRVYVFGMGMDRQELIVPVMERLQAQAKQTEPVRSVTISGFVRSPGDYPLEDGMRISRLIHAGGGLIEGAYSLHAELTRQSIINGEYRETQHITVNLKDVLSGNSEADMPLMPHDVLHIKSTPLWYGQQEVEIGGEVRFPGVYPISRGETLSSLIKRAGGLTEFAYPDGAVFMREELRMKEQEQIDILASRIESDMAANALEKQQNLAEQQRQHESNSLMQSLVTQLRKVKAVGRMVIDLPAIESGNGSDIVLKAGDKLHIPVKPQEVTVIGEVHFATSHLYKQELSRDDYINMSGGATYKADTGRIYVVQANGTVIAGKGWFWRQTDVKAGDTIVVPLDSERIKPLTMVTNVAQILYQLGLAAAAWNAVGAL
ncbi:MAG: SLBB domain-containing protein [Nitrospirae bacterium]|nr:SLBB domain-containing protein [Nitrospirota bacterium]